MIKMHFENDKYDTCIVEILQEGFRRGVGVEQEWITGKSLALNETVIIAIKM